MFADDIGALAGYYRDVLELREVGELDSPHFRGLWIGSTVLGFSATSAYALLELAPPVHGRDGTTSFLTFEVPDDDAVDVVVERAVAHGGTVVQAPHRTYYGAWQAVLRDPEGNVFRLNHLPLGGG